MSMKYLGAHFDIHGGGQDLVFPHHENEIAQSEAATGEPFASFWCENGLVNLGGEKMSKSTGNLFFIDDIAARVEPEVVRYYLLSTHYRSPIEFSEERLAEAGVALQRLHAVLERSGAFGAAAGVEDSPSRAIPGELGERVAEAEFLFRESMDDDFNSARAIGHLFDLSRHVNRALDDGLGAEARAAGRALFALGSVLGLFWLPPRGADWAPEVLAMAREREAARKAREWQKADALRRQLLEHGVLVEDAPDGFRLKRR
jgi:cysteinyl-tRNA synthetase